MNKERCMEVNTKWNVLVDDLSKSELKKYKYSQAYERIVKHNAPKDYKILLGIAHRVFSKDLNIQPKRGKTEILINEFNDDDFVFAGTLMMDFVMPFIEATSDMIIDECHKKDNTFSHLIIKNKQLFMIC